MDCDSKIYISNERLLQKKKINMMRFIEFYQLKEDFDNLVDFLLNPIHRNKSWKELFGEFTKSGGEILGKGRYGTVYGHPKWNYVAKVFVDQDYLKFVRFASRNPHPSFPRFIGAAQKIVPFYRRSNEDAIKYIIRMEKLEEVADKEMLKELMYNYQSALFYFQDVKIGKGDQERMVIVYPSFKERRAGAEPKEVPQKVYQKLFDMFEKYPQTKNLCEAIHLVHDNIKTAALDIHSGNIMQRANGELVLTDPLWQGSNPYADAQRAMDMETDRYGNMPSSADTDKLMGGELPKKKLKKKPKKRTYKYDSSMPF